MFMTSDVPRLPRDSCRSAVMYSAVPRQPCAALGNVSLAECESRPHATSTLELHAFVLSRGPSVLGSPARNICAPCRRRLLVRLRRHVRADDHRLAFGAQRCIDACHRVIVLCNDVLGGSSHTSTFRIRALRRKARLSTRRKYGRMLVQFLGRNGVALRSLIN